MNRSALLLTLALCTPVLAGETPQSLFEEARRHEQAKRTNHARRAYERLVRKYPRAPQVPQALYRLSWCYDKTPPGDRAPWPGCAPSPPATRRTSSPAAP